MILAMQPPDPRVTTRECSEGARLFLWCIRRWVMLRFQNRDPVPVLRAALAQHRIPETASDLDRLMCCIAAHARRKLEVRSSAGIELSADEHLLTRALAAALPHADLATALMRMVTDSRGATDAARFLQRTSAALRCCGLDTACDPAQEGNDSAVPAPDLSGPTALPRLHGS